jgi:glycine oxidase
VAQDTAASPDVVVIGAGAIGLSIAWQACVRGLRVLVLERDRIGRGTSWHAAGMIAPVAEVRPGEEPLLTLGLRSSQRYPSFVSELLADAGLGSIGYERCGTLFVARDADEAEALERELALRGRYDLAVERLLPSEARRREPALAPALRLALDLADDHAIDPRALCEALAAGVRARGGEVREGAPVASLRSAAGRVTGVSLQSGERIACEHVVVAAGTWVGAIEGLGDPVPVSPVKGQIMRLHDPAGPGLVRRVIRMGHAYVVPRADGRYVIGATSEERGFDTTVTAGAAFALLREAGELVPGVSELVIDEFTAGLRPGTPDNLPAIGPGSVQGLVWAVGHRRGGILLAPVTAALVTGLLAGEPADPMLEPVSPERFATAATAAVAA